MTGTNINTNNLKELWEKTLGVSPTDEQFYLWTNLHTLEVVRQAILKTAGKNLQMGKAMTAEHKVRFASKVMLTITSQNTANARNREALRQEFERDGVDDLRVSQSENRGSNVCI
jgi:hypothetical protein